MELKMLDFRAVSLYSQIGSGPYKLFFTPFLNSRLVSGSQFCSYPASAKTCNLSISNKGISSTGQGNFATESFDYQANGVNGATSAMFSRGISVLESYDDEYGGVIVNPEKLPSNPNKFASRLWISLAHWKTKGKKGIWLKLPLQRSELVPIAVKEGFEYHHAERGYVMMTYWIPEGPCMLPSNASHQVGTGGFVLNGQNEVLVVQEKHYAPTLAGLWKIPTGFILESEEIFSGAVREVKEETGVDTEFEEVIAFRHVHNVAFEKSDLFFICMLRPLSTQITIDDQELLAAKDRPSKVTIGSGEARNGLYYLRTIPTKVLTATQDKSILIHHRLDHPASSSIPNLISSNINVSPCDPCLRGSYC